MRFAGVQNVAVFQQRCEEEAKLQCWLVYADSLRICTAGNRVRLWLTF